MNVTVKKVLKKASLVEYYDAGSTRRCVVPTEAVHIVDEFTNEGWVTGSEIKMGIPYGVPWDDMPLMVSGTVLGEELHKSGIWTYADIETNPDAVMNAIRAVLRLAYDDVRQFAKSHS